MTDKKSSSSNILYITEFIDNPDDRCPCVFLVDLSFASNNTYELALRTGFAAILEDIKSDPLAAKKLDISIITNNESTAIQDFVTANNLKTPPISMVATTSLDTILADSLNKISERIKLYQSCGVSYFSPKLFLMSDGQSSLDFDMLSMRINEHTALNKLDR